MNKNFISETKELETDKRHITVIFCDLVGSTKLSRELETEDLHKIINEYQLICESVVNEYGGFIAQYLGDGVLIYFGYPRANENDTKNAIEASLDLLQKVKNTLFHNNKRLNLRIGIHTGSVIIAGVGGKIKRQGLALGDTPNTAAIIQQLAKPGQIVVSSDTHELTDCDFKYKKLSSNHKKLGSGKSLYSLTGKLDNNSRFEARIKKGLTKYVGRKKELDLLENSLENVNKKRKPHIVLLKGEAGIGKSRLLYEFKQRSLDNSFMLLETQCWENGKEKYLRPIISLTQKIFKINSKDSNKKIVTRIESVLKEYKITLKNNVPLICNILSVTPTGKYKIPQYFPEKLIKESFRLFIEVLRKISLRKPIVLIVEDLHWADSTTIEMLEETLNNSSELSILLIMSYRPEVKIKLNNSVDKIKIDLESLDKKSSLKIIKNLSGSSRYKRINTENIFESSDGLPLYLEEITKSLINIRRKCSNQKIPSSLNEYLMTRLDSLDNAKRLVQLCSVLGKTFEYSFLKSVVSNINEQLDSDISQLLKENIIYEVDNKKYEFKHSLIQHMAYDSIPRNEKNDIHSKVASTIKNNIKDHNYSTLAFHQKNANEHKNAAMNYDKAGEHALKRNAFKESIAYFDEAFDSLNHLQSSGDVDNIKVSLLTKKMYSLFGLTLDKSTVADIFKTSYDLESASKKIGNIEYQVYSLHLIINLSMTTVSDMAEVKDLTKKLKRIAGKSKDDYIKVLCYSTYAVPLIFQCNLKLAKKYYDLAIDNTKKIKKQQIGFAIDSVVQTYCESSFTNFSMGFIKEAFSNLRKAKKRSDEINNIFMYAYYCLMSSVVFYFTGNYKNAWQNLKEIENITNKYGRFFYTRFAEIVMPKVNYILTKESYPKSKVDVLFETRSELNICRILYQCIFADYLLSVREFARVGILLDELKIHSDNIQDNFTVSELYRLKAEYKILMNSDDTNEIKNYYLKSIDLTKKQGAKYFRLRTANSYSKYLIKEGRNKEALKLLKRNYAQFTDGFNTNVLKEAKTLIHKLENNRFS